VNAITPGSVIQGTTRPYDLIASFMAVLQEYNSDLWVKWTTPGTLEYVDILRFPGDPWWESDEAYDVVLNLIDALDELSPPGFFFGAHSGDPTDYGFWPISQLL
jgi:hypothetical protein